MGAQHVATGQAKALLHDGGSFRYTVNVTHLSGLSSPIGLKHLKPKCRWLMHVPLCICWEFGQLCGPNHQTYGQGHSRKKPA